MGGKGHLHFLEKESCINSDIYINQVLEELRLPFYKQYIWEKNSIIWIDASACYHMSKNTDEYCRRVRLIGINWPAKSSDLNPIENLWQIVKVNVSAKRH